MDGLQQVREGGNRRQTFLIRQFQVLTLNKIFSNEAIKQPLEVLAFSDK